MPEFTTLILKFANNGDKTNWTYIEIPADIAQQLKPGNKKTFRAKGRLDNFPFAGIALLPMGEGNFLMPLNAAIRRGIGKGEGAPLKVYIEEDTEFKIEPPPELLECLDDDAEALAYFHSLARSHRDYFIKWIESAKTYETRARRIVNTVNAMVNRQDYGQMIRSLRNK